MKKRQSIIKRIVSGLLVVSLILPPLLIKKEVKASIETEEKVSVIVEFEEDPMIVSDIQEQTISQESTTFYNTERESREEALLAIQESVISDIEKELDKEIKVEEQYTTLINGVVLDVQVEEIEKIREIPGVSDVYENISLKIELPKEPDFMISANGTSGDSNEIMNNNELDTYNGAKQVIAVLDTELNTTHEAFAIEPSEVAFSKEDVQRMIRSKNLHAKTRYKNLEQDAYLSGKLPFVFDYSGNDINVKGSSFHGSHVSGLACGNAVNDKGEVIFQGAAPNAQLIFMKIADDDSGSFNYNTMLKALEDAYLLGVDAINLSLGRPSGFSMDYQVPSINRVVGNLHEAGINVNVAAGNEGSSAMGYGENGVNPANYDFSIIATPSVLKDNLSVASINTGDQLPSSFSSLGIVGDMTIKPEISAPGGNVLSANLRGSSSYVNLSGTSMATPNITGASAIIRQMVAQEETDKKAILEETVSRITSTAIPVIDPDTNTYASIKKQGNGMVNISNALHSKAYTYVEQPGKKALRTSIAQLGEDVEKTGTFQFDFHIVNDANEPITYELQNHGLKTLIQEDGLASVTKVEAIHGIETTYSNFISKVNEKDILSLNPKEEKDITVTLQLTEEEKAYYNEHFTNGSYVEGYLVLTPLGEQSIPLTVGYLGFFGDYTQAPIFEEGTFIEPSQNNKMGLQSAYSTMGHVEKVIGSNIYDDSIPIKKEHIAISGNPGQENNQLSYLELSLLRNAKEIKYEIFDSKGKVVFMGTEKYVEKSRYIPKIQAFKLGYIMIGWMGTDMQNNPLPNGDYQVKVSGILDYEKSKFGVNENVGLTFPIKIDRVAPEVIWSEVKNEGETISLLTGAYDNNDLAYLRIVGNGEDGQEKIYYEEAIASESRKEVQIDISESAPDTIVVFAEDYAGNQTTTKMDIKKLNAKATLNRSVMGLRKEESENLMVIGSDKDLRDGVVWTSSNSKIVSVDQKGLVRAESYGQASIYAKLKNNQVLSCEVAVINDDLEVNPHSFTLTSVPKEIPVNSAMTVGLKDVVASKEDLSREGCHWSLEIQEGGQFTVIEPFICVENKEFSAYMEKEGNYRITCEMGNWKQSKEFRVVGAGTGIAYGNSKKYEDERGEAPRVGSHYPTANEVLKVKERLPITVMNLDDEQHALVQASTITSSNEEVLKIHTVSENGTEFYEMEGVEKGTAKVTMTAIIDGITKLHTFEVEVVNEPASIEINHINGLMSPGTSGQFKALVKDLNGKNIEDAVRWKSYNTRVATVDKYGRVTAKVGGKAIISGETSNGIREVRLVSVAIQPEWVKDKNGWWYDNGDGTYPKQAWKQIKNQWYYFDNSGYMKTGWVKVKGIWYYLKDNGAMKTGWVKVKGTWYYLKDNGAMKTGWVKVKGIWYYLKDSGAMATGWVKIKGTWYYLKDSGVMATGWIKLKNKWYYLEQSGTMKTGWLKDRSKWYYLEKSGIMAKKKWIGSYYVNENGVWLKS